MSKLIFLIPVLLTLIWFSPGYLMGAGESGLPFYNLNWQQEATKFAWKISMLGNTNGITTASFPTYWFLSRLQLIGIPGYLIQAFVFWMLFTISGLSVYLLTKELFPSLRPRFTVLAVLYYWFNPASLVNIWSRFLNNYMVFYALLPTAFFFYLKGIKLKDYKFALLVGLITATSSYALTSVPFIILLWFAFSYISVFYILVDQAKINRFFYLKYFVLTLIFFTLVNSWWLSQFFNFIFSSAYVASMENFFSSEGNLGTLTALSQRLGSLVNVSLLMHDTYFTSKSSWSKILITTPVIMLNFLVTLGIFWVILKYRHKKEIIFLGFLFIFSLLLMKGNNPPFGEVFQYFFAQFLFLQVFRNPFEKFSFIAFLVAAPLFALSIEKIVQRLNLFSKFVYIFSFLWVLLVWGYPFWTGSVFARSDIEADRTISYQVSVPEYYESINRWLKKIQERFRFLVLPLGGEGMTYKWDKSYSGIELSSSLFEIPNVSFNTSIPYYQQLVTDLSKYQLSDNLLYFLPFINSKYVIFRDDIDFKQRRVSNPQSVQKKLNEWVSEKFITESFQDGKLKVYEVDDKFFWPFVYVTPEILYSNETDFSRLIAPTYLEFPNNPLAIINIRNLTEQKTVSNKLVIKPNMVYSPINLSGTNDYSNEDLLVRLFHAKYLPGDIRYLGVRIKEEFESPQKSNLSAWIEYRVAILGKRAVEIYKLRNNNAGINLINDTELLYKEQLEAITPSLIEYIKTYNTLSTFTMETLRYQLLLLKNIGSKSFENLKEKLEELNILPRYSITGTKNDLFVVNNLEVPKSGEFYLNVSSSVGDREWYLDGKRIKLVEKDDVLYSDKIYVAKGLHEVAYNSVSSEPSTTLVSESKLSSSEQSGYVKEWALPDIPRTYKIEFEFRFRLGQEFTIESFQDIDYPDKPVYKTYVAKKSYFHDWSYWQGQFNTSSGATKIELQIKPLKRNSCNMVWWGKQNCKTGNLEYEVDLRDFKITQVQQPDILLISNSELSLSQSKTIWRWARINPSMYIVKISKISNAPEILVLSELFNSGWKVYKVQQNDMWENTSLLRDWHRLAGEYRYTGSAYYPFTILDREEVSKNDHYLVNTYANGWLIDKPGDYNIILEFMPQRTLYVGGFISILSFVAGSIYLLRSIYLLKRINK